MTVLSGCAVLFMNDNLKVRVSGARVVTPSENVAVPESGLCHFQNIEVQL